MKQLFLTLLLAGCAIAAQAQTYADTIAQFRKKYIAELLEDKRQPVKPAQTKDLDFYPPNKAYRVWADFKETPGSAPFKIPTHSGKQKPYREYGVLTFTLDGETCTLHIYQSIDLLKDDKYKDYLFIPFRDRTNYETTYAGGRYIDLTISDIRNGKLLLDLNKCYNPYCAYADGFNCPIPPDENSLAVEVRAGEKLFKGSIH